MEMFLSNSYPFEIDIFIKENKGDYYMLLFHIKYCFLSLFLL